jgi:NhaP-type Na+/H+ or K+/H+ antiporter
MDLIIIGIALVVYAAFSKRLSGTVITAAMVFVVFGYLAGSEGFGILRTNLGSGAVRHLAEATLALVLFTDAAGLDSRRLEHEASLPARLLGIGLPLTIVLGTLLGLPLFPHLGFFEVVVLAVMLAPTDAALGQAVVSDRRLASKLRQGLNVESGLNDGVCVPLLFAAVAFAQIEERSGSHGGIITDLVKELLIATAVGAAVAALVVALIVAARHHDWIDTHWEQIIPPATAMIAYIAADELGGSGFIACFVAGLVYGRMLTKANETIELAEEVGTVLGAATFLVFGAIVIGPALSNFQPETLVYAVLSLTIVRMVPVGLAMLGSGAQRPTVAFTGWFGPRGLATIVFMLTIVDESGLTGTRQIVQVATFTVLLSVFAHGMTASPLTDRYVRWTQTHDLPSDQVETEPELTE